MTDDRMALRIERPWMWLRRRLGMERAMVWADGKTTVWIDPEFRKKAVVYDRVLTPEEVLAIARETLPPGEEDDR